MIVITTPTGSIGHQVLDRVLESGEAVRVIVRDPARLPEHVRDRVEVVQGSHGESDVIAKALVGADALFWLVPPSPGFQHPDGAERYYREFTRGACEAITAASAAAGTGTDADAGRPLRVVVVSTLGHGYQGGDAGFLSAALTMDRLFEDTGVDYRALALPFFMENLLHQVEEISGQGTISMANTADRPLPAVATRDAAAVAAALLLDPSWRGQASVPVTAPEDLTPEEMAQTVSEVVGRTVRYRQTSVADLRDLMGHGASRAMAQDMADMVEAQNNGIYDAEPRDPASTATAVIGGDAGTGFRQWCEEVLEPAVRSASRPGE